MAVAEVFIPPGAQYFSGPMRVFYRVEKGEVQLWKDQTWQSGNQSLRDFEETLKLSGFVQKLGDPISLRPLPFSTSQTGWYAQFMDKAEDFGRIDENGNHPARGTIFQAYRFPDEAACRAYCKGKELLLVPCKIEISAKVSFT